MKKASPIFVLLLLVMFSCSSDSTDSSDSQTDDTSSVLLKKRIKTTNGTSITENFTYDGNKLVSIETSTGLLKRFIYTNNLITKVVYTSVGGPLETNSSEIFEYNAINQLIKKSVNIYQPASSSWLTYYIEFVHQNDNTISYIKHQDGNIVPNSGKISLTSNQMANVSDEYYVGNTGYVGHGGAVVSCYGGTKTKSTVYEYDDKLNPIKNILGFKEILFAGVLDFVGSVDHNVKLKHTFTTSIVDNNSVSPCNSSDFITTTRQYDTLGFPTSSYQTISSNSVSIYEETYFYE